ncbi:ArsR/SmtB family transcription factor [Egicoccus sp. AB-alg2]|uniref:ArsR/SmtB family transcription factor n=1 Tax=Egicoccus sp. AB-alg2 TaxID=3242693 RepID=UPI00359CFAFB
MTASVGRVLGALADDTRRTIVTRLAEGRMLTATELADELPITRQAVTKHLRVLEDAEVVTAQRHGRESRYRLQGEPLRLATAWIEDVGDRWDRRLAALKAQAERDA